MVANKKGLRATKRMETKVANMSVKRSTHIVIKNKSVIKKHIRKYVHVLQRTTKIKNGTKHWH